jgi:hypothetical protein
MDHKKNTKTPVKCYHERKRIVKKIVWKFMMNNGLYITKKKPKMVILEGQKRITDYFGKG